MAKVDIGGFALSLILPAVICQTAYVISRLSLLMSNLDKAGTSAFAAEL